MNQHCYLIQIGRQINKFDNSNKTNRINQTTFLGVDTNQIVLQMSIGCIIFYQTHNMGSICPGVQQANLAPYEEPIRLSKNHSLVYKSDPKYNKSRIKEPENGTSTTSLILGCEPGQRRDLCNKYLLAYHFFVKNQNNNLGLNLSNQQLANIQINDFTQLLTQSDENPSFQQQVKLFQEQYIASSNLQSKANFLITEYFKNGYFFDTIEDFPIQSTDPTLLSYLRRPIVDLHNGIRAKYKTQKKKKEIYCVIQIPKNEIDLLYRMVVDRNHFTFSTFLRCFSNEQKAKARFRQLQAQGQNIRAANRPHIKLSAIFFTININKQLYENYDYGFYQDESQSGNPLGDIIMNILNFFEVTGVSPNQRQYDLNYGSLARMKQQDRLRHAIRNPQLLSVIKVIEGELEQIKTHSSLIRIIAERGLSITASNTLKEYALSQKVNTLESINLVEAYLENRDFTNALRQCKSQKGIQFDVLKGQILYEMDKTNEAEQILQQIRPNLRLLQKDHFKEYTLHQFISSKIMKKKGQVAEGRKQLEALRKRMRQKYPENYQYIGRYVEKELSSYNNEDSQILGAWQEIGEGLNISVWATR